jgi:hypothetical protein
MLQPMVAMIVSHAFEPEVSGDPDGLRMPAAAQRLRGSRKTE